MSGLVGEEEWFHPEARFPTFITCFFFDILLKKSCMIKIFCTKRVVNKLMESQSPRLESVTVMNYMEIQCLKMCTELNFQTIELKYSLLYRQNPSQNNFFGTENRQKHDNLHLKFQTQRKLH